MSAIQRESTYTVLTIDSGESESEAFEFYPYGGGMLYIPSGWTSANIGFKVSHLENGTYSPLRDETGVSVEISAISASMGSWYNFPIEVFGARWIKLWSKSSVIDTMTDTAQGTDISIAAMLKV